AVDAQAIERMGNTEIRPGFTYGDLWQREFALFEKLDGRYRPKVDYTSQELDSLADKNNTAGDTTPEHQVETAKGIINTLEEDGITTYAVGAFVRDKVPGNPSKDIDTVTTAMPDQVVKVFTDRGMRVYPKGEAYGVISVVVDGKEYEIATTRVDGPYSDGR